jgi:hypothetical protein
MYSVFRSVVYTGLSPVYLRECVRESSIVVVSNVNGYTLQMNVEDARKAGACVLDRI